MNSVKCIIIYEYPVLRIKLKLFVNRHAVLKYGEFQTLSRFYFGKLAWKASMLNLDLRINSGAGSEINSGWRQNSKVWLIADIQLH